MLAFPVMYAAVHINYLSSKWPQNTIYPVFTEISMRHVQLFIAVSLIEKRGIWLIITVMFRVIVKKTE